MLAIGKAHYVVFVLLIAGELVLEWTTANTIKNKRSAEEGGTSSSWTDQIKGISSGQMPSFGSMPQFGSSSFSSYIPTGSQAAEKSKRSAEEGGASSSWTDQIKGISSGQMPSFGSMPQFGSSTFSSYIPTGGQAAEKSKRSAEEGGASSSWTDQIKGISSGQMPSFGSMPQFGSSTFSSYIPTGGQAAEKSKRSAEEGGASSSWTDQIKGISSGQMPSFGSVPQFGSSSFSSYIPTGSQAAEKSKRSADEGGASSSWTDQIKGISSGQMPSFGSMPQFGSSSFSSYIPTGSQAAEKSKRSADEGGASSSWTDQIKGISSGQMPSFGSVPQFGSSSFSSYIPTGSQAAEKSKRSADEGGASSSWTDQIKGISSGQMPSFGSMPQFGSSSFSSYIPTGSQAAEKSKRSADEGGASSSWTDQIKGISSGQMPSFGSMPQFGSSSFSSYIPTGSQATEKSKRSAEEGGASSSWTDQIKGISSGQMPSFGSMPQFGSSSFSSYIPTGGQAAEKSKRSAEEGGATSSWTDQIKGISSGQMPSFGSVPQFGSSSFSSYIPTGGQAAEKSKRYAEEGGATSSWTDQIKGISSGQMPSFGSVPQFGSSSFSSYIPTGQAASSSSQ